MKSYGYFSLLVIAFLSSCEQSITKPISAPERENPPTKQATYDFVSGVQTLSVLSNDNLNKKVYLFGESHNVPGPCPNSVNFMNASDLVYKIPSTSNKFIDIFLEAVPELDTIAASKVIAGGQPIQTGKSGYVSKNSPAVLLRERLTKSCYQPPHRCPFSNMRAHWTDLRQFLITLIQNKDIVDTKNPILSGATSSDPVLRLNPILKNFLSPNATFEYLRDVVFPNSKIKKEWEGLPPQYFRSFLTVTKTWLEEQHTIFNKINQLIKIDNNGTLFAQFSVLKAHEKVLYGLMAGLLLPMTDAYAIGRFLRGFKVEPHSKQPSDVKNAVFLYGKDHTSQIKKFLLEIGFKLDHDFITALQENNQTFQSCINVIGLQEPLF